MAYPICGAKKRNGPNKGEPCRRPAGWGTNHPGTGRCKLHGGCSTGPPKGSKNHLITGEYEKILYDMLTDEEKLVWDNVDLDRVEQLKHDLRVLTIRELRMMKRIKKLEEQQTEMLVESREVGHTDKGEVDVTKYDHKDNRIIKLEEALTRVEAQRVRVIEALTKIYDKAKEEQDMGHLDDLMKVIQESNRLLEEANKDGS